MDLSLDDLIKKNKKVKNVGPKKKLSTSPAKKGGFVKKPLVGAKPGLKGKPGLKTGPRTGGVLLDARSKIINKNRTKIRDARERIAENARKSIKDARELLSSSKKPVARQTLKKTAIPARGRPAPRGPKSAADFLMEEDFDIDELSGLNIKPIGALKLTVRNEMFRTAPPVSMPKMPTFGRQYSAHQEPSRVSPDPFDCYVVPTRQHVPPPPMRPERMDRYQTGRISAHMDAYEPRKSILRAAKSADHDDRFDDDRYFSHGSDNVRSRLYNESRDRNESAGIFAKLPVRGASPPPAQHGHRIIISNLHPSVSESDVKELFEDVGPLVSAKLVRPGISEVIYKSLGDAEEAVETYHNRQLDGQPMKCMLVKSQAKASYSRM